MITRKIRLPLNAMLEPYLSSDNYIQGLERALNSLDVIYTYFFRYPWLFDSIEGIEDSRGFGLNFTANNPAAGIGFTLLLAALATVSAADTYQKQCQAEKNLVQPYQNGYRLAKDKLKPKQFLGTPSRIKAVDDYLTRLLQENEKLGEKYANITITTDEQIEFTLNPPKEENTTFWSRLGSKMSTAIHSSWVFWGLTSFVYWIVWIGYGVLMNDFTEVGIGPWGAAGYAIPLAVVAPYPVIKMYHWWRNNFGQKRERDTQGQLVQIEENPQLTHQAAADARRLMHKIILADEKVRLYEALGLNFEQEENKETPALNYLSSDDKTKILGHHRKFKAGVTFVATTVSTFIGAQYVAWILTGILGAIANITFTAASTVTGLSIAIIAGSVIYGAYKAYKRYQEVKQYRAQIKQFENQTDADRVSLEQIYEAKRQYLADLCSKIDDLSRNPDDLIWLAAQVRQMEAIDKVSMHRPEEDKPKTVEQKVTDTIWMVRSVLSSASTGITLVRFLTIAGAGIFVLGVITNPYTLSLLVVGGVLWAAFGSYQKYQAAKEAKAKVLFEKRQETLEILKDQNKIADLQIQLLEKKQEELQPGSAEAKQGKKLVPQKLPQVSHQSLFKKPAPSGPLDNLDKPDFNRKLLPVMPACF